MAASSRISVAPDDRFPTTGFDHLSTIGIGNFEVIETTGPSEGPRAPGAPGANAGPDQFIPWGTSAILAGTITDTDAPQTPVTIQWSKYDGPGTVTFANASAAQTTASFSLPGRYTLKLTADDGIHSPAYDAVVVQAGFQHEVLRSGNDIIVRFPSLLAHQYRVERASAIVRHFLGDSRRQPPWHRQSPSKVTHPNALDRWVSNSTESRPPWNLAAAPRRSRR
jgi:hypothetical protein